MISLIPVPFLAVTSTLLVWARMRADRRKVFFFKPASTLLVIAVALLSLLTAGAHPGYTLGITVGLVFSLGGDVALIFPAKRAFLAGLLLFLVAHVVYSITFTLPNGFHSADLISAAVLLVLAVGVYLYLRPGLGSMKGPVILYMLILFLMVNRANSAFFGAAFTITQAWLMSLGAVLFWLSDLALAVNRFRHPFKAEPLSLFLYYGGQLLIALSPSYFR
jgi:uncharacterized membrane protein YhhN